MKVGCTLAFEMSYCIGSPIYNEAKIQTMLFYNYLLPIEEEIIANEVTSISELMQKKKG